MDNIRVRRVGDSVVEYFQQVIGGEMFVKFAHKGNTLWIRIIVGTREDTDHYLLHCRITAEKVFGFFIVLVSICCYGQWLNESWRFQKSGRGN